MKVMLDCRAFARLLVRSQDHAPALAVRARMRLHLITCQACRNVDRQVRFVRTAMRTLQADLSVGRPDGTLTKQPL